VLRNRIIRRLHEVFLLHRATIPAGWDIVLNPRTPMATIPFTQLVKEVLRLFPRSSPMASAEAATPAGTSQPSSAAVQRQSKQTSR
jgi:RNase P protein component